MQVGVVEHAGRVVAAGQSAVKPTRGYECALLKRRQLAGPNFHALRHRHASHMLRNGVDIKMRLGHSKASFTLAQYCRLLPGQDEEAARRVDTVPPRNPKILGANWLFLPLAR